MLNGKKIDFETNLKDAFESGYVNAASSLSKMTKDKVFFHNFHHSMHKLSGDGILDLNSFSRNGTNFLVTTEIFGDVTGKSYLLLSQHDFDLLTNNIRGSNGNILKEEYIKELDNILSAAVITKLSNDLKLKMYGDIPMLETRMEGSVEDTIFNDFKGQTEEIYVNSIFFSFDGHSNISPFFIWVMSSSILSTIETKLIH